ncbi:hypothetical protein [Kitasatospora sp. NPDC059327]|uniref:hypothetical protein n=1 Tax=Kitasatospora sp. NPDC059327 TaxID=3346803 RepID=UPI0036B76D34
MRCGHPDRAERDGHCAAEREVPAEERFATWQTTRWRTGTGGPGRCGIRSAYRAARPLEEPGDFDDDLAFGIDFDDDEDDNLDIP